MKCKDVRNLISDYVDGSLHGAAEAELESHIDECPACRSELHEMAELMASLASMGGEKSPVDLWGGVRAKITSAEPARRSWWVWVTRPLVAVPAAGLVALFAIALIRPSGQAPLDKGLAREYTYYIGSHWRLQRQQAFVDPDVVLVRAELQKSVITGETEKQ